VQVAHIAGMGAFGTAVYQAGLREGASSQAKGVAGSAEAHIMKLAKAAYSGGLRQPPAVQARWPGAATGSMRAGKRGQDSRLALVLCMTLAVPPRGVGRSHPGIAQVRVVGMIKAYQPIGGG